MSNDALLIKKQCFLVPGGVSHLITVGDVLV